MGEGLQLESGGPFKAPNEAWPFKSVSVSPDVSGRAGSPAVYRPAALLAPRSSERRSWRPKNSPRRAASGRYHLSRPSPSDSPPFAADPAAGFPSLPPFLPPSLPRSPFPASPGSQQLAASGLSRPWRTPAGSPSRARPLASWGPFLWPVPQPFLTPSQPPHPLPGR